MGNSRKWIVPKPSEPLQIATVSVPSPSAREVVVRVAATALNFADLLIQQGKYQDNPPFPLTQGLEICGRVHTVGKDVDEKWLGKRVAAQTGGGGLAEHVVVGNDRLIEVPQTVSDAVAAAFPIAYGTSHLALTRRGHLKSGETLIVLGAAGGVGLTAVELGKQLGAHVIAVARGKDRLEICRKAGAHELIDSSAEDDLRETLLAFGKANVLYDAVGGSEGAAAQRCLAPEGRHLLIGFASGDMPTLKPNHLLVKNLDVIGVNWSHYIKSAPELVRETLSEVLNWIAQGKIAPHVGATYPFEQAPEALERLKNREVTGKIVVTQ